MTLFIEAQHIDQKALANRIFACEDDELTEFLEEEGEEYGDICAHDGSYHPDKGRHDLATRVVAYLEDNPEYEVELTL